MITSYGTLSRRHIANRKKAAATVTICLNVSSTSSVKSEMNHCHCRSSDICSQSEDFGLLDEVLPWDYLWVEVPKVSFYIIQVLSLSTLVLFYRIRIENSIVAYLL